MADTFYYNGELTNLDKLFFVQKRNKE